MEIDKQAPLVSQKQIFIEAPPQTVWSIHTDIDNWSKWQRAIAESKVERRFAVGSVFRWKSGGLNVTSTIQVIKPGQEIAWTGRSKGAYAKHIWRFASQNNGTLVMTEESMDGWSIRLLKLFNPKFLDNSLDTWLRNLKIKAEKNAAEPN